MIELELRLEPTDEPQRPAAAWLISGDDPQRWLEEITSWQLDERRLTLLVLPSSASGRAPGGVLVVANGDSAKPARTPRALPFGRVANGFYVPVNARLLPAMTPAELETLKQHEAVVFHPGIGMVGFALDEILGIWDLLVGPREREGSWRAQPIELEPHPRIESIAFRTDLTLENLFGSEAGGIGSKSPDDLPPSQNEPRSGAVRRQLEKLRGWMGGAGNEPRQASAFERMEQWVSEHVPSASRELTMARNRSLLRLLDQLEKDPDAGLKHALPLNGSGLHRGVTPPSAELGNRMADFSLERLRGGGAADYWQVPPDLLQQLRLQYLQLAERERQLGRYRRAAYIHAELLGDLLAAARVLSEGDHWREAAVLYREHLHQPMEAASCFVKARMIPEAVAIYEEAKAFEPLGDLYLRLGEQEKAMATFRNWADQLISERRLLQAASVLEQKLDARQAALELLESAWPDNPEAGRCLERCFAMRANAGEHEQTATLLKRLAGDAVSLRHITPLLRVLGGLQTTYPDRQTRALAEELGRRQIARCIALAEDDETRRAAIRLLPGLAPDDRLLTHDANRFLDQHSPKPSPSRSPRQVPKVITPAGTHSAAVELLAEFSLPGGRVQWTKAAPVSGGFCVAGISRDGVALVRCTFEGETQELHWQGVEIPGGGKTQLIISSSTRPDEYIFLAANHTPPLAEHDLPASDGFPRARVGSPGWLADPVSAAAFASDRTLWVLRPTPTGAVISGFQKRGQLVASFPAPPVTVAHDSSGGMLRMPQVHLAVADLEVIFAAGSTLYRCGALARAPLAEFDEQILGLEPAPAWSAPHVAVLLESRIAICWLGVHQGRVHVIDVDVEGAVAGFTNDRLLVVMTHKDGYVFDADSRGGLRSARFGWRGGMPLAVMRGPIARSFIVVDANGDVRILRFSLNDLK